MADGLRILFVSLEGRIAGAEKSLLLLLMHVRAMTALACPAGSPLADEARRLGVPCHPLAAGGVSTYRSLLGLLTIASAVCRLIWILIRYRPRIIHANNMPSALACIPLALIANSKLIWHVRDFSQSKRLTHLCGRCCSGVVAVSHAIKHDLVKQGVEPQHIRVIYNGVAECDLGQGSESGATRRPSATDTFVFANVGQFVAWKNQRLFLEAAANLVRHLPQARFLLVGDDVFGRNPEYRRQLLQMIEHLGIQEKTTLCGWQPTMSDVWARTHCLVHTAEREPFGRVIIEAMAAKVPIIAVRGGGPEEVVRHGQTGLLVPPGDATQLSGAMLSVARHRKLRNMIVREAFRRVSREFTASRTAERVQRVYQEVLLP